MTTPEDEGNAAELPATTPAAETAGQAAAAEGDAAQGAAQEAAPGKSCCCHSLPRGWMWCTHIPPSMSGF